VELLASTFLPPNVPRLPAARVNRIARPAICPKLSHRNYISNLPTTGFGLPRRVNHIRDKGALMAKPGWLFSCLVGLLGVVFAQNSAANQAGPELQIIRYGWSHFQPGSQGLETGVSAASSPKSPRSTSNERQLEVLRQNAPENKEVIAVLEDQQRQQQLPRAKVYSNQNPTRDSRYKYTLELKNTAQKQIVEVGWDYVFLDPRQPQEALRYHFVSRVKIKPTGKSKFTVYTEAAPYGVLSAKDTGNQSNEKVIIKQIIYADGAIWTAP
jgi:hypothetical protein